MGIIGKVFAGSKATLWGLVVLLVGALGYQRKDRKLKQAESAAAVAEQNEKVANEVLENVVDSVEIRESVSDMPSSRVDDELQQSGYFRD